MISLIYQWFQWGRSEVVVVYPDNMYINSTKHVPKINGLVPGEIFTGNRFYPLLLLSWTAWALVTCEMPLDLNRHTQTKREHHLASKPCELLLLWIGKKNKKKRKRNKKQSATDSSIRVLLRFRTHSIAICLRILMYGLLLFSHVKNRKQVQSTSKHCGAFFLQSLSFPCSILFNIIHVMFNCPMNACLYPH